MELNLAGVDTILNSPALNTNINNTPDDELDLTGVSSILSKAPTAIAKPTNDRIVFQPENNNWSLGQLPNVQNYFKQTFNKDLPISVKGQGAIHNKWHLNHENSADIGLHPNSVEGQKLIAYLRENNIPFLAFNHAIKGVATSAHIHIGNASHHGLPENVDVGELDLTGVEDIIQAQQKVNEPELALPTSNDLDLTNVKIDPSLAVDPNSVAFKQGTKLEYKFTGDINKANRPNAGLNNPNAVGELLSTTLDLGGARLNSKKLTTTNVQTITDTWLRAWNPEYETLNKKFRQETGGLNIALVDNQANVESLGGGKYKITSRPSKGVQALFEAYKKGGLPAFNATNNLINKQIDENNVAYQANEKVIADYQASHPYISAIKSAGQEKVLSFEQLSRNILALPKALYYGNRYGWDSQQFIDEVNKETELGMGLAEAQEGTYKPPTILGKAIKATAATVFSLPELMIAGRMGVNTLPLMVYAENYHRGNREATLAALPMAIMVGGFHGAGEFLKGVNYKNINTIDEFGEPINKTIAIESGGTAAPFVRTGKITQKDLSLYTKELVKGKNTTITNLTPLERQLILRGANGLVFTGASLVTNPHQDIGDVLTTLFVGLGMPVGKGPRSPEFLNTSKIDVTSSNIPQLVPKIPLQIEGSTINVPITKAPIYGKLPVLEYQRGIPPVIYPSAESPNVGKYGESFDPYKYVSETETGFQASGQGQTLHLDLDTAALNLVELKRNLANGDWSKKGAPMQENLQRQKAVQNAIAHLEKVVPEEVQKFFGENEEVIRGALRGNVSNRIAKENFIKQGQEQADIKPHEIQPNAPTNADPLIQAKLDEVYKKLGDAGTHNVFTSREAAADKLDKFFKITKQGTLQASTFGLDILVKKSADAAYIGAFYIEDFYRRGVEPTVDLLLNKLRTGIGDFGSKLTEDHAKEIFNQGMAYYNSNKADPFFSRMKQEAAEKLPNRFTAEQARNILSQHENEWEWTVGLQDFIGEKINNKERINKQELIDIINKGQVRVEASVASEEESNPVRNRLKEIQLKIDRIEDDPKYRNIPSTQFSEQDKITLTELREERTKLHEQGVPPKPKYSLREYTGEKLELPGAVNSKEVKLISPETIQGTTATLQIGDEIPSRLYKPPHWDEWNVVAHYRSNDRTTTDNIPISFSEEFQSDWNHDIRTAGGYRGDLTTENFREKGYDIQVVKNAYGENGGDIYVFGKKEELPGNYSDSISAIVERAFDNSKIPFTEQEAINYFIKNRKWKNKADSFPEPNPFMQHSWKELVFKRFLRDAIVAKDENGNNKYEGIGWTTARQQKERYGKILEGKDFDWRKNNDGTYTFGINSREHNREFDYPHELAGITLERFAELTTKEAAEEVRSQEAKFDVRDYDPSITNPKDFKQPFGKFSLKEAVELRSGIGKYSDYDVAMVNYAKKIGKRFGAKYSQKEIPTIYKDVVGDSLGSHGRVRAALQEGLEVQGKLFNKDGWINLPNQISENDLANYTRFKIIENKAENIHFLEITPSMRESLSNEGLPLYGLGGEEKLTNQETGIRNRITSQQGFDEHRNSLVESLTNNLDYDAGENKGTVFNSGLNPDAFIDQVKLLYKGYKDFQEFSSDLLIRFGEQVKPYLQDLWIQVKDLGKSTLKILDDGLDYLQQGKDSPVFKARQVKEGGFIGSKSKSLAGEKYKLDKKRTPYFSWYSLWRGVGLAQLDTNAGEVYNVTRAGQRVKNSMESQVLFHLRDANDRVKNGLDENVAKNIWIGNERKELYTVSQLAAGDATVGRPALNTAQIGAYLDIRKAIDINLDIRRETKLYSMREKANRLNEQLLNATPNTPQWDSIAAKLIDLSDSITKVQDHFDQLKKSGYISTQRRGKIVGYTEDASGKIYQHFDSFKEADAWIKLQEDSGADPLKSTIYDVRKPERLRQAAANLTPGQFEDFIDAAGVNSHDPEVEKLRDEVYSRFPSFGYELKRDFTRGYDRNWQFVLESVAHQTETYANSFYSRVAGEEALKKLDSTSIQATDHNLYTTMQKYIDHEISSPEKSGVSSIFGGIRKGVYLFQLGFDINQLYLNALGQPLSQTFSYFGRVEHNGIKLSEGEVHSYFARAGKIVGQYGKRRLGLSTLIPADFDAIRDRLISERVIEPEFNRQLLESEAEKTVSAQLPTSKKLKRAWRATEHWAGVFMRNGELVTRTHAAAEAFLIGKEKFNLQGEDLVDFIVRAVDATQTNPTRAEAPLIIRGKQNQGEVRKLLYQFNAFNHMWLENLALNVRADFRARGIRNTTNHLAPLVLMGGISGLPLAGLASTLYTLITGEDPKKKLFDKLLGNDTLLEHLVLYGITTNQALSQKLTPGIPFVDNIKIGTGVGESIDQTLAPSNLLPAVSTGAQISKGFSDLIAGDKLRAASSLLPFKPLRNIATAIRYNQEGIKTRKGRTIVPKSEVTFEQKFGQVLPGLSPSPTYEYYRKAQVERVKSLRRKLKRVL